MIAAAEQRPRDPVEHPAPSSRVPIRTTGKSLDLARLDQRQRLEQLVERPEAARQDHERVGVLHEHDLAGEEVAELDAEVDVRVEALLLRQLDVAADRQAAALLAAAVGGFHDPRAAAGDDRVAGLRPASARGRGPARSRVARLDARGPEDADRRADLGQRVEALDELGQDPQRAPRVGVEEVGTRRALEQRLVLGQRHARPARGSASGRIVSRPSRRRCCFSVTMRRMPSEDVARGRRCAVD